MERLKVLTAGMVVVDRIKLVEKAPSSGDVHYLTDPGFIGGHPSAISIDLVKLGFQGNDIGVVAAIGADADGRFIEDELRAYGVNQYLIKSTRYITGQDFIFVPEGQDRIFNISAGANQELTAGHVKKIIAQTYPEVFDVRVGYSGIDNDLPEILSSLPENTFVLVDIMHGRDGIPDNFLDALQFVDAVHCNEAEAMLATDTRNLDDAVRVFKLRDVNLIFITHGADGAELITPSGMHLREPAFKVDAVDMTGCGDAFCAGIIKKVLEHKVVEHPLLVLEDDLMQGILQYGQAVGAACATGIGITAGVSQENVRRILWGAKRR